MDVTEPGTKAVFQLLHLSLIRSHNRNLPSQTLLKALSSAGIHEDVLHQIESKSDFFLIASRAIVLQLSGLTKVKED